MLVDVSSYLLSIPAAGFEGFWLDGALATREAQPALTEALEVVGRTARLTMAILQNRGDARLAAQVAAGHDATRTAVTVRDQHRTDVRRSHQHGRVGGGAVAGHRY